MGRLVDGLNAAFRAAGLPHVAVCVPSADEDVDADIEFRLGGQRTRFALQVADGGRVTVFNEYGFEAGELVSVRSYCEAAATDIAALCRRVVAMLRDGKA